MLTKNSLRLMGCVGLVSICAAAVAPVAHSQPANAKPNIVFIMGDDVGWFNIGAYNQGIMAGRTPNLDRLAARGDALHRLLRRSQLHGRPGEFHHRPAADPHGHDDRRPGRREVGMPAEAPTIATVLKTMGYATGQFGKNHLGDLNQYLPTVHGFDEFYGYLYHLDAMEDPCHPNYPPELKATVGPRNMVHSLGDDMDDATVDTALGQGRKAEDRGCWRALPQAHGDGGRRDPRPTRSSSSTRRKAGRQAVLPLAQPDAHARRDASFGQVREDAHARERLVASRKPAWRSSTTSSARS